MARKNPLAIGRRIGYLGVLLAATLVGLVGTASPGHAALGVRDYVLLDTAQVDAAPTRMAGAARGPLLPTRYAEPERGRPDGSGKAV
jgi:hypothetical protein